MGTAAPTLWRTRVADGLSQFAVDELQYILDVVGFTHAGAPPDKVTGALLSFQRVRQLDRAAVEYLTKTIADPQPPAAL